MMKIKATYVWDCNYVKGGVAKCFKVNNSAGIMMNGISFDGKDTIAVSDTLDRSIKLFRIKSKTSELELF